MKRIAFNREARERLLNGVNILSQAVSTTLGPKGRNVCLQKVDKTSFVTKDGVSVAKEVQLEDEFENIGVSLIREAATKTAEEAGDGTTTATVLASSIYSLGHKLVAAGHNPMSLKQGIDVAVCEVVKELRSRSLPVTDRNMIVSVGTISANGDNTIAETIADAMDAVGSEGVITVESGTGLQTTLIVSDGMQYDRGYISPYFVTDIEKGVANYKNILVAVINKKISNVKDILSLLEAVHSDGRPLLLIAEEVDGDALTSLVLNKVQGKLQVVAVKAPYFGDRRRYTLDDICTLTGATVIGDEMGVKMNAAKLEHLGTAASVVVSNDSFTIVSDGKHSQEVVTAVSSIKNAIATTTSAYEKEMQQVRLAKLCGGVGIIRVGGKTEVEMAERKDRVEDALHATRAAVDEGIIIGGGCALAKCVSSLNVLFESTNDESRWGIDIVRNAIVMPLKTIAQNCGVGGEVIINAVQMGNDTFGWNAQTQKYEDLLTSGVIDPLKVTRVALENAASVAGTLLTTECIIAVKDQK